MNISGFCDAHFQTVADAFESNFRERDEVGASVSISVDGKTVVDLWGGCREVASGDQWGQDTLAVVFSCTKAATALCAQILIDRGLLDPAAPVTKYWPEFATNGKGNATVLMTLNHSVGVPAFHEPIPDGGFCNWQGMAERVAAERPFWKPGTQSGYHMISFGWIVGELIRRISGQSLGSFFAREIAEPLDLDFFIGLPESEESRVAPAIFYKPRPDSVVPDFTKALADRSSLQTLALLNTGRHKANSRESHAAEIGGAGGIANARSLMKMFTPLANGGMVGRTRLLSSDRINDMRKLSAQSDSDSVLLMPTRFGQGFMLSMGDRSRTNVEGSFLIGDGAFGHVGMGGSAGFADPERGLAFGYVMNRMGGGVLLDERGQSLVDSTYAALG